MLLNYRNLTVRNASPDDAVQLAARRYDGTVMAHAGFPRGLNQTAEERQK